MNKKEFRIDRDLILKDLAYSANKVIYESGNAEKNNFEDFLSLNDYVSDFFGAYIDVDDILCIKPYLFNKLEKYTKRESGDFRNFIISNKDFLTELSKNIKKVPEETGFYDMPYKKCLRGYKFDDIKNIILSFYASYSPKYYEIVKRYFDEGRVENGIEFDQNFAAMFLGIRSLNSGYIFANEEAYNSMMLTNLVHEYGHAIESETFIFPQKKQIGIFADPLVEVPSMTFEHLFSGYLINNKIDYTGGLVLRNLFYHSLFETNITFEENIKKEDLMITDMGEVLTTMPAIVECEDNEYELELDYTIPIREILIYNLGSLYALYFYKIDKDSRKIFLKLFNDILTSKKEDSFMQSIKRLGVSPYDFAELKYVKEDIKEDTMKLKKRFNYYS